VGAHTVVRQRGACFLSWPCWCRQRPARPRRLCLPLRHPPHSVRPSPTPVPPPSLAVPPEGYRGPARPRRVSNAPRVATAPGTRTPPPPASPPSAAHQPRWPLRQQRHARFITTVAAMVPEAMCHRLSLSLSVDTCTGRMGCTYCGVFGRAEAMGHIQAQRGQHLRCSPLAPAPTHLAPALLETVVHVEAR
jgi:hypothetical protein